MENLDLTTIKELKLKLLEHALETSNSFLFFEADRLAATKIAFDILSDLEWGIKEELEQKSRDASKQ